MEITLDSLLTSRDARAARQKKLMARYPGRTVVCLTVIMPGKVKRNLQSLVVAQAAVTAVVSVFRDSMEHLELLDLSTGYEAYLVTSLPAAQAKAKTCHIEDNHSLGRLFDIDVIGRDGVPMSRTAVGEAPRKCLICGESAAFCMRNRTHTQDELLARISEMIDDYVQ